MDGPVVHKDLADRCVSLAARLKARLRLRAVALALVISGFLLALTAGAAFAGYYGNVWLNWVYTGPEHYQYSGYTHLKEVGVEPGSYDWGCANMWKETAFIFGSWYCGSPGHSVDTPELGGEGRWAEPVVVNKSSYQQQLWGWEYYYA